MQGALWPCPWRLCSAITSRLSAAKGKAICAVIWHGSRFHACVIGSEGVRCALGLPFPAGAAI